MNKKTAFYTRISKADRRGSQTSNSITNQLGILYNMVSVLDKNCNCNSGTNDNCYNNYPADKSGILIYTDDGYSGRSSKRPAFRKLVADAMLGRISTILVKDFSRFSREHILMSEFLEKIFPENGIRFISVTDRYDSLTNNANFLTAFKSLFNEYYCRDISQKTKSVLAAKKEAGSYCTANVPYGYKIIPQADASKVLIDKDEARVVQKIFSLALSGLNCRQIANELNMQECRAGRKHCGWDAAYIWTILDNPFYAGFHVWHKYEMAAFKTGTPVRLPKDMWKISDGSHDAIVSKEVYGKVSAAHKQAKPSSKGRRHIFHGITRCRECHKALCAGRRQKSYLCCNNCGPGETKKIQINLLCKICIIKIREESVKYRDLFMENNIFNNSSGFNLDNNPGSLYIMELLLHNFISKIYIGNKNDIDIFWNFHDFKNTSASTPDSLHPSGGTQW